MTIKYETITTPVLAARFVKLTTEQLPSIPTYLSERVCRKTLSAEELARTHYPRAVRSFGLFEAARFETVDGTFVPNGNDVLLLDGDTIIEFEPLVKAKTSLDTTYLVDKDGNIIENSPMIDNHWMDESAEREYSEMLNFANSINK